MGHLFSLCSQIQALYWLETAISILLGVFLLADVWKDLIILWVIFFLTSQIQASYRLETPIAFGTFPSSGCLERSRILILVLGIVAY